jgi:hypothetical protein
VGGDVGCTGDNLQGFFDGFQDVACTPLSGKLVCRYKPMAPLLEAWEDRLQIFLHLQVEKFQALLVPPGPRRLSSCPPFIVDFF